MREYHWRLRVLMTVLLGALSMGGCGVKGPLYLPDKQSGSQQPEAPPEEDGASEDEGVY